MGKVSVKENKSVYQIARDHLGLSRAAAVEYIPGDPEHPGMDGITEDRLVKLESGLTAIQPADVVAMAKRYNEPGLRNYYCCHECPIGAIDAPEVVYKDNVHQILVNMVVSLESVNSKKSRLMEILSDGVVDDTEIKDLNKILEELEKISMTIESIQLWCEKVKNSKQ